jgi:hypothetical protein
MVRLNQRNAAAIVVITRSPPIRRIVCGTSDAMALPSWGVPGRTAEILIVDLAAVVSRTDREQLIRYSSGDSAQTILIDDGSAPRELLARIHASEYWYTDAAEQRLVRLLDSRSGALAMSRVLRLLCASLECPVPLKTFLEAVLMTPEVASIDAIASRLHVSPVTLRGQWRIAMNGSNVRLQDFVRAARRTRIGAVKCHANRQPKRCQCLKCITITLCSTSDTSDTLAVS